MREKGDEGRGEVGGQGGEVGRDGKEGRRYDRRRKGVGKEGEKTERFRDNRGEGMAVGSFDNLTARLAEIRRVYRRWVL